MAQRLKVTRNQLASFLTDPELVRQFELLFDAGNAVINIDFDELSSELSSAVAKANIAFALVSALAGTDEEASNALSAAQEARRIVALLEDVARVGAVAPPEKCCPPTNEERMGALVPSHAYARSTADDIGAVISPAPRVPSFGADLACVAPPLVPRRRNVGAWHDMTRQVLVAPNVERPMLLGKLDIERGIRADLGTGGAGKMYVSDGGIYDIQFSAQIDSNKGSDSELWIWLRINGIDVPESASVLSVKGNDGETVAAWNWLVTIPANTPFQIMWTADTLATYLEMFPAAGVVPDIPSVIVTVTQEA